MAETLPPLRALQIFEAAARHLSMTAAAGELCVTPGAVSLQIRALETRLGVALFQRHARRLTLTPQGEDYFRYLHRAFQLLHEAGGCIHTGPPVVTLGCTPTFALQWLLPQLADFERLHPEIEVRITSSNQLRPFGEGGQDLAVRHGLGHYPGLISEKLLEDELVPVCHPSLARQAGGLATPADLRHCCLLHDEHRDDWRLWLTAAGADEVNASAGPVFHDCNGALEAAQAGQGVALARRAFVASALAAGQLIIPFALPLTTPLAYWLVYPSVALSRPPVAALRRWLLTLAGCSQPHKLHLSVARILLECQVTAAVAAVGFQRPK